MTPDTDSISNIVKLAYDNLEYKDDSGKVWNIATYVLPEFQRDFTWSIQQSLDLFDSLIRDVYIGSIVLGQPSFDIAVRRVDDRYRSRGLKGKKIQTVDLTLERLKKITPTKQPILILDGQQRISSLVRALHSDKTNDQVYFVVKERPSSGRDFKVTKDDLIDLLEEFSAEAHKELMSIEMAHVWKHCTGDLDIAEDEILTPLRESEYYKNLPSQDKPSEEKYFRKMIQGIEKMLDAEKIVQVCEIDTSLDNFTLFFERSNTKGVKLDFIDILTAKVYTKCRLRDKWENLEAECGLNVDKAKETIVRMINYFSERTDPKKNKLISKASILSDLTGDEIEAMFDTVSQAWSETVEWLITNHIVPGQTRIPYPFMVMPIMAYRITKGTDFGQCPPDEIDDIVKWITTISLAERYSMKTNDRYLDDISKFIQLAKGNLLRKNTTYLNQIRHNIDSIQELIDVTASSGALPRAIHNLVSKENKGFYSWHNGTMITEWSGSKNGFESHHIYPKAFLEDKVVDNIESIVNRVYIPKKTNIKISDRNPKDYLGELADGNPKLDTALELDHIPLWVKREDTAGRYREFLEERAEKLLELIEQNTF